MVSSHDERTNMTAKSSNAKKPAEYVVKDIRRATRRRFSVEDKIRIVLDGRRGADALGGVPIEILYDRMKTAVTGEDGPGPHNLQRSAGHPQKQGWRARRYHDGRLSSAFERISRCV